MPTFAKKKSNMGNKLPARYRILHRITGLSIDRLGRILSKDASSQNSSTSERYKYIKELSKKLDTNIENFIKDEKRKYNANSKRPGELEKNK